MMYYTSSWNEKNQVVSNYMNNAQLLKIFAETRLETSSYQYSIISLDVHCWDLVLKNINPDEFISVTKERDEEISLIIATEKWESFPKEGIDYISSDEWRLLTFTGQGLLEIVGYLAKLSVLLAQNNISILAFSTFNKSHLLVREEDYNKAQAILKIFLNQPFI